MKVVSIAPNANNLISRPPFQVPLSWLLVLEVNSPILNDGGSLSVVFWVVLKQFSSRVFLAIARARQCASKLSNPESGSPRNHCTGCRSWCRGKFGSLP